MEPLGDITLNIPAEHFDSFALIMEAGLQRAKLSHEEREALSSWWEAEKALMAEELQNLKNSEI